VKTIKVIYRSRSMPPWCPSIFAIHRSVRKSRHTYWVVSVIALLGFACFPVLAKADSSNIQYEESIATATGKSTIPSHSGHAHVSTASGGGSATSQSSSATAGSEGSTSAGAPTSRATKGAVAHRPQMKRAGLAINSHARTPGTSDGSSMQPSSGGGSSPLVPVLIAIAALAAVSIAAVVIRRRRQLAEGGVAP
jgi:cobalamin biosynthesis Mg chelatase CobN